MSNPISLREAVAAILAETQIDADDGALALQALSSIRSLSQQALAIPKPDQDALAQALNGYEAAVQEDSSEGGDEAAQALDTARTALLDLLRDLRSSIPVDQPFRSCTEEELVILAREMFKSGVLGHDTEAECMGYVRAMKPVCYTDYISDSPGSSGRLIWLPASGGPQFANILCIDDAGHNYLYSDELPEVTAK